MHFINPGLVDEDALYYVPVIVGAGDPVFKGLEGQLDLELVEERRFASGLVFRRYVPRDAGT